jgi:hypothetical protein
MHACSIIRLTPQDREANFQENLLWPQDLIGLGQIIRNSA